MVTFHLFPGVRSHSPRVLRAGAVRANGASRHGRHRSKSADESGAPCVESIAPDPNVIGVELERRGVLDGRRVILSRSWQTRDGQERTILELPFSAPVLLIVRPRLAESDASPVFRTSGVCIGNRSEEHTS